MKTKITFSDYLFCPFRYIAGLKSLLFGLLVLLILSLLSNPCHIIFDGALDAHFFSTDKSLPFFHSFYCVFISWITVSVVFYLTALILSGSVRLIDMAGTLALAKAPMILFAVLGFIPAMHIMPEISESMDLQTLVGIVRDNIMVLIISAIVSILVIVWLIVLMYNAFSVSSNLKGNKGIISFIIALIISEIISKWIVDFLIKN